MSHVRARVLPPLPALRVPAAAADRCCPGPGETRVVERAVWWYGRSREWRIVPEELCTVDGGRVAWRRPPQPLACRPRVWCGAGDVVYAPLRARGIVVAVRVLRVAPRREDTGGPLIRGLTAEGDEIELRRGARAFFADAVEAALEIAIPPRLDAVVDFEPRD